MNHEQGYVEQEQSKYAEEGTKKHEEMQSTLEGKPEDFDKNAHVKALLSELKRHNLPLGKMVLEGKLERKFNNFILSGTPDFSMPYRENGVLKILVVDYKFGYMLVPAKNNPQLLAYILLTTFNEAKIGIFQNDVLDIVEATEEEIELFHISLKHSVMQAKKNVYNPDPIACQYCRYRPNCKSLANKVTETTRLIAEKAQTPMSPEEKFEYQKALILNKKFVDYALEDAEKFFKNSLEKGGFFDFVELKSNGSVRSWSKNVDEKEIIDALVEISGKTIADFVETKIKTLTQIKNIFPDIPAHFIESREKAKSLKVKGGKNVKDLTEDLF